MPDIIIHGMKMPGSCAACDFYNVISGRCRRTGTKINFSELTTRSVDCPISELPPHGDLIDRKELCDGLVSNHPVVIYANTAPVIVPASEEGG